MPVVVPAPRLKKWTRERTRTVGDYRVFSVERLTMTDGSGFARGDFFTVHCPDWVNVLAVTEEDELVLVWQYRLGSDTLTLEIPGGMIDAGESPIDAVRRELREETGYEAAVYEPLLTTLPNPALSDNRCHTFLARGARRVGAPRPDEHEELEVTLVPARCARALVEEGHVTHALIVCALQAFAERQTSGT
jgi:ADP-ribose pyrophosphatase